MLKTVATQNVIVVCVCAKHVPAALHVNAEVAIAAIRAVAKIKAVRTRTALFKN